jgi:hypothetical protein
MNDQKEILKFCCIHNEIKKEILNTAIKEVKGIKNRTQDRMSNKYIILEMRVDKKKKNNNFLP